MFEHWTHAIVSMLIESARRGVADATASPEMRKAFLDLEVSARRLQIQMLVEGLK